MSDPIDPIMQAAERLRRVARGEDPLTVYYLSYGHGGFNELCRREADDLRTLADFLLSILPKGKRPEPVRIDRVCFVGMSETEGVDCFGERPAKPGDPEDSCRDVKVYDSGEAGTIEAQFESLERHLRTMDELAREP